MNSQQPRDTGGRFGPTGRDETPLGADGVDLSTTCDARWGTPGYVSDAGFVPPPLPEDSWDAHHRAYFDRIRQHLQQGERPIRVEVARSDIGTASLSFPAGPYIGDAAIVPEPGATPPYDQGYAGYDISVDTENENPGYYQRPYLIPGDPDDLPVPLPYGIRSQDAEESAAIVRRWIIERLNRRR